MCCSGCRRVTVVSGTRYAADPVVDLEDLHAPAKRAEPRLAQDSSGVRVGLVVVTGVPPSLVRYGASC